MPRTLFSLALLAFAVLVLTGLDSCQPEARLPDLIPSSPDQGFPGGAFCNLQGPNDQLKVVITVINQGNADAGISLTRWDFNPGTNQATGGLLSTPPIAAGAQWTLPPLDVPDHCGAPDCVLKIKVNEPPGLGRQPVVESNYNNNSMTCVVRIG